MGVADGSGVSVGVSVGVGVSVMVAVTAAVAASVGVTEGVPGPGVGVSVPAVVGVAVGVSSSEDAGALVGTLATEVGGSLPTVGCGVPDDGGKTACGGVAVGIGDLGVLVGVGVAAGPLGNRPQAIVSQARINKNRLIEMILHRQRCVLSKGIILGTHPPKRPTCENNTEKRN